MVTVAYKFLMSRTAWRALLVCAVLLAGLFAPFSAGAKDFSFTWSANPEPVEGYKLYYKKSSIACCPFDGSDADQGPSPINVGKVTSYTLTGLAENTSYHFTLTAYNGSEESGYAEIVSVVQAEVEPVAAIVVSSQEGDAPFSVTFDGSSSSGTISEYSWTFGDGETATGATVNHTFQVAGSYTVTLNVETPGGLSHQTSTLITVTEPAPVTPPPGPNPTNPVAVISSSSAVGAAPLSLHFDGSGSSTAQPPIVSYSWDFGDGSVATGAVVSHTFSAPGTYQTVLTVRDSANLSDQISTPVLVSESPQPQADQSPVSSFTATPGTGAAPLKVVFNGSASSVPNGSITQYRWSFGDGTTATGPVSEHTFTTIGEYSVTLSVTDNRGASSSSTQTVSVRSSTSSKNDALIPILNFLLLM